MPRSPALSFTLSATVYGGVAVPVGQVLLPDANSTYVPATAANRAALGRRAEAIALTPYGGTSPGGVQIQEAGTLDASLSGLGAGAASWVRCSAAGFPERFTPVNAGTSDVIGYCETDGRVHLQFGVLTETMAVGGGGGGGSPGGSVTPEFFGAKGDGVTNDQSAFTAAQAAIAAGTYSALILSAKAYKITSAYVPPAGSSVIGQGYASQILIASGQTGIQVTNNNVTLLNFRVIGVNAAGTYGVAFGVSGGATMPADCSASNVYTSTCYEGFRFVNGNSANFNGPTIIGCTALACRDGFTATEQAEYMHMSGCEAVNCTRAGLYVASGNLIFEGGNLTSNVYGVYLAAGANDGHGIIANCNINHNASPVHADAIVYGMTFVGCHYYGGETWLNGSDGVTFVGCRGYFDAGSGLLCNSATNTRFIDCVWTAPTAFSVDATSSVEFLNNSGIEAGGGITAMNNLGAYVRKAYVFPGDANQTLSKQDSVAQVLVLTGSLTATRTITSARAPFKGISRRIVNNTAQSVAFKWSTGTAVTIAAGTVAVVGSDGTNAVIESNVSSGGGGGAITPTKVSIGTNPATGGDLNLANGATVNFRNAANSVDYGAMTVDSAGNLLMGDAVNVGAMYMRSYSGGGFIVRHGATDVISTLAGKVGVNVPLGADASYNATFKWARATVSMTGNTTATAAQYSCRNLRVTSTGTFDLVLPLADQTEYRIKNTSAFVVTAKVSGQTGVAIPAGATRTIVCTATDYEDWS